MKLKTNMLVSPTYQQRAVSDEAALSLCDLLCVLARWKSTLFDSYGSNRPDHYRWVIQQKVPQIRYNKSTKRARNNYIQYILIHFANIFCRERGPPDNDEPCFSSDGILRCSQISGHHFRCADKPCTTVILVQRSELPRMSIAVVLRPHQSWTDSKSRKDWYNMMPNDLFMLSWERTMTERPLTAERLLRSLSVTGKLLGFHYTAYMIEQVAVDPARVHLITKRLYPETAQKFGTTDTAVERAVRTLIDAIWDRTDHEMLEHIAGTPLKRPPTNTEFLDMMAEYLKTHR